MLIATWLLHESVPAAAKIMVNPLGGDPADIAAGRDRFRQKCEACHGYDGSGKTEVRAGQYPRPPKLQANIVVIPDGEIFYHIRNGIRNTGMPAWSMPDIQIWQLVAYLRHLPVVTSMSSERLVAGTGDTARYVASAACRSCHTVIYDRWSKTRMANVVRDPKQHPDVTTSTRCSPPMMFRACRDDPPCDCTMTRRRPVSFSYDATNNGLSA